MFKGLGAFCSREEMERMFEESFGVLWKQMENGLFMGSFGYLKTKQTLLSLFFASAVSHTLSLLNFCFKNQVPTFVKFDHHALVIFSCFVNVVSILV